MGTTSNLAASNRYRTIEPQINSVDTVKQGGSIISSAFGDQNNDKNVFSQSALDDKTSLNLSKKFSQTRPGTQGVGKIGALRI